MSGNEFPGRSLLSGIKQGAGLVLNSSPIPGNAARAAQQKGGSPEAARQGFDMTNVVQARTGGNVAPLFSEADIADTRRAEAWLNERLARSAQLGPHELFSEIVTITPAAAEVILARCNRGNRALRKVRVNQYAEAISDGRWKLTAQGLSFSRDGFLNNGQHRLHAIIAAARPVQMMVTFGEDRSVFDVLDNGGMRGASDTLHVAGYKNTARLAAAARLVMIIAENPTGNVSYPNDVVKQWVDGHADIEHHTTAGHTIGTKLKSSPAGVTAAFYLIATLSAYERRLPVFQAHLNEGALPERRNPILILRDGMMKGDIVGRSHPGIKGVILAASIIKAWNLWVRGKNGSLPAITWSAGQSFPTVE